MPFLLPLVMLTAALDLAHADPVLVLNCVFETSEARVIETLSEWANAPAGGVIVPDKKAGIELAREIFRTGKLSLLAKRPAALVNAPKVVRIDVDGQTATRVCAIMEGEPYASVPSK